MKLRSNMSLAIVIIALLSLNVLALRNVYATTNSTSITKIKIPIYMISTRGNQNNAQGVQGPGYNNNYQFSDISQLFKSCPTEVAIFVHGWAADQNNAKEQLDRVKMSLEDKHNNYNISLIGFSWNSKIDWSPAKLLAKENGPKLAQFILDFKDKCADSKIRLIAHSLGSRVVLSALESLHTNQEWKGRNFKIMSVHLMGAAVDDREVSMNPINPSSNPNPWWTVAFPECTLDKTGVKFAYGDAIRNEVNKFYNMVDSEDNALQFVYPCYEGGNKALGNSGKDWQLPLPAPVNYIDIPVQAEIKPVADADGDGQCDLPFGVVCTINIAGDNHMGYMGFRNPTNTNLLEDDGAMNVVITNWRTG